MTVTGGFVRRVGWIRIGALGDLLVGLASLRETLDRWPEHKITVIGSKLWLQIIDPGYWPQIDRIAVTEKSGSATQVFEIADSTWVQRGEATSLRRELARGYDVIFNARVDSPRQGFAAFFAGVPERWGAAEGLARLIYNRQGGHDGKDPLIHERDVPLLLMDEAEAALTGDPAFRTEKLADRVRMSPRIAKWRKQGLPTPRRIEPKPAPGLTRYFAVNPTSSRREKAWPSAKFRELLLRIRSENILVGLTPVIVGAPNETDWLREVAGKDFMVVQPADIQELYNFIAGSEFLMTNTSSVQFIAASVATKTLTLMGRARPEVWGPLGPDDRYVKGYEPLDEPSLFDRERRAYAAIKVDEVLSALISFLP